LQRSLDVIHPRRRPLRPEARVFLQMVKDAAAEVPFGSHAPRKAR
jgi:hypothetical protein